MRARQQKREARLAQANRKAGARSAQLLLIPLMLFIVPAVFIMIFAPLMLQFINGGSK